jgi:ribose transport system substrate-binding protein
MFIRKGITILAATAALALALGGCAGGSQAAAGNDGADVDPGYAQSVQDALDAAMAPQAPLELAANPAIADQNIAIVAVTLAETGALRTSRALTAAIEDMGWTSTTFDGQGSPTVANQRLEQAVTTNPDAIVLISLDPTDVGSGLQAAAAAGIPVSCAACWDLTDPDGGHLGPYYADVTPALSVFEDMGYYAAAYAYPQTDGHPHFLWMHDPALSNLSARDVGFERFLQECTDAGGDCRVVAERTFQVANATTTLPADGASLAQANPDFNAYWVSFDFAGLQVLNGLRQAGLATNPDQFMVSSNGDGPNLEIIQDDGYVKVTVAISFEQEAYALVDNLNRILQGQEPIEETVPIRVFDQTNADEAQNGNWSGDVDYRAAYLEAWGR